MRRVTVGLLLLLAVAGCATPVAGVPKAAPAPVAADVAPGVLGAEFTDAQRRFAVAPPADWSTDPSGRGGTAVIFLAPRPDRSVAGAFTPNINVYLPGARFPLAETIAGSRQELRGLDGYTPTADEPVTLRDGTPAHLLGGTFTDPGSGLQLRNLQLITVTPERTVVASAASLARTWAGHEDAFRAALGTLSVAP